MFALWRPTFVILGVVFLIAGIGLAIFVGAYVASDYDKIINGERADAAVIQAHDNGKPILEFRTARGQRIRIEGKISVSPSPYRVGERIAVFFDPAEPEEALIDAFAERWFLPLLFGGFGTIFLVVGGVMFSLARRGSRRMARLQRDGLRVDGRIAGFEISKFAKINGRRLWHVLVDWTDASGVTHRSRSEMLRDDPSQRFRVGDRVTVLVDPANPAISWVDLVGHGSGVARQGVAVGAATSGNFGKTSVKPVVRRR